MGLLVIAAVSFIAWTAGGARAQDRNLAHLKMGLVNIRSLYSEERSTG